MQGNRGRQSTDPVQTQQSKRVPDGFDTRAEAKFRGVGYQKEVGRQRRIGEENVLDIRNSRFVVGGEVQQIQGRRSKVGQLGEAAGCGSMLSSSFYLAHGVTWMRKQLQQQTSRGRRADP
jgi:hypothetical protein